MDNKDVRVFKALQAIFIGTVVAFFLLKTNRVPRAMELYRECLILLGNKTTQKEETLARKFYRTIYLTMFHGYGLVNDHSSAIQCGRKLLVLLQGCGRRDHERVVTFQIARLYQIQHKYEEAKQLYMKALSMGKKLATDKEKARVTET